MKIISYRRIITSVTLFSVPFFGYLALFGAWEAEQGVGVTLMFWIGYIMSLFFVFTLLLVPNDDEMPVMWGGVGLVWGLVHVGEPTQGNITLMLITLAAFTLLKTALVYWGTRNAKKIA